MNLSPQKTYIRLPTTRQLTPTLTLFRMLRHFHNTLSVFEIVLPCRVWGLWQDACLPPWQATPAGQAEGLGSHRPRRRPPSPLLVGGAAPKPPLFVTPFYMKRGKSLCKHLIASSSILGIFWYERKTLYLEILKERGN